MTAVRVRAPASTANLGPGFDCAAVALDLWNELEVTDGDGELDVDHLGVRAFARLAPLDGRRFTFVDRIPRERGLGSSAAVIALGLVAAAAAEGLSLSAEELLAEGVGLEGHADNLAAALAGGVCLTWDARIARLADDAPAVPIALVPEATVSTAAARAALPEHGLARRRRVHLRARRAARSGARDGLARPVRRGARRSPARAVPRCRRRRSSRPCASDLPPLRSASTLSGSGPDRDRVGAPGVGSRVRAGARRPLPRRLRPDPVRLTRRSACAVTTNPYSRDSDPAKRHSAALTDGPDRAGARAMLKGTGFTDEDLARPIIGVATNWIETMPCNLNQRDARAAT